jgi:hypothetical protein
MSIPFSSSEHFHNETMALSRHTKPMKLSALRLAIAKHAGFSSVQAYKSHLDQGFNAVSDLPSGRTDSPTFIVRQGNVIMLQAKTDLAREDFDYIDDWNDMVEKRLIGKNAFALQEIGHRVIDGDTYVSGFLDVTEEEVVDQLPEIVEHFCKANKDEDWGLTDLAEKTLLRLLSAFFDASQGEQNPLTEVFAAANQKGNRYTLEPKHFEETIKEVRLALSFPGILSEEDWLLAAYGFGEYSMDRSVQWATNEGRAKNTNKTDGGMLLLAERRAAMLATMINIVLEDEPGLHVTQKDFVCGLQQLVMGGMGQRNRLAIKASFFTNQVYRMDDMKQVFAATERAILPSLQSIKIDFDFPEKGRR